MTATLKDEPARADAPAVARPAPGELKFTRPTTFITNCAERVDEYFNATGLKRRDCPRMYVKTAVILGWFAASYVLLVFAAPTWWIAVPLALSLSLSLAAIGFNIMHDGGHRGVFRSAVAQSSSRRCARICSAAARICGISSTTSCTTATRISQATTRTSISASWAGCRRIRSGSHFIGCSIFICGPCTACCR